MSSAEPGLGDAARPGTGEVTATVIVKAPAERVFAAFMSWEKQSEWIPFTKVRLVRGDGGEGSLVEAITTVGPAVLRDELEIVKVNAPYEVRVVHCGKVLRGPGAMRCTPNKGAASDQLMTPESDSTQSCLTPPVTIPRSIAPYFENSG